MATQVSMFKNSSSLTDLHVLGEVCPLCEQPIPHDRFDEIKARIESRANTLESQFAEERRRLEEQGVRNAELAATKARAAAKQEAEEAAREKIKAAEDARVAAELAHEQTKADAIAKEAEIRADAVRAAQTRTRDELKREQEARVAAEAKASQAETQLRDKEESFKKQLSESLDQQREVLEAAKATALSEEKAANYKERLKWHEKVQSLERALEKKSNDELGEGAEVNLYDALRSEFPDDRIERIAKGKEGADIRHVVMHNDRNCGTILYDSKNHGAWRTDFLKKLASDRLAERAEHAILSTRAFPAGVRQVHKEAGIIVANPARVCAIVQIVREHMIHCSTLRLSAEARTQKTAALYEFITSERCSNLLNRIDQLAEQLLELQVTEQKAHQRTWQRQGELLRTIQKTRADLCMQIDTIVSERSQ